MSFPEMSLWVKIDKIVDEKKVFHLSRRRPLRCQKLSFSSNPATISVEGGGGVKSFPLVILLQAFHQEKEEKKEVSNVRGKVFLFSFSSRLPTRRCQMSEEKVFLFSCTEEIGLEGGPLFTVGPRSPVGEVQNSKQFFLMQIELKNRLLPKRRRGG